ncbi:hypothetical protein SPRG_05561 [Saprolegnia parasitica CBS 223.65]|uniref:Ion transport domain-containing protein n=1 Tax=Saprolegnia parasitica (strain CBS 223.65) TaxID=695850 RepID=A0A067CGI1_SAPPC|nr:hypothetical protein SPRG_05561 [Saprolegnia parasitica CBS 223.65]KDO29608.1 hypothetical protein SPRG_05561 [Saprolegnia parasitica CBS 223.65]|eukprot:XP_012199668.1 hypothetical protein SPRG_05561 [Saprolegnia parasitica CBS 223.65]
MRNSSNDANTHFSNRRRDEIGVTVETAPDERDRTSLQQEAAKAQQPRHNSSASSKSLPPNSMRGEKKTTGYRSSQLALTSLRTKVRDSMLFSLLHNDDTFAGMAEWDRDAIEYEKKKLVQRPVMRLLVLLKWRAFGLRKYTEQILVHLLLLLALTVSLTCSLLTFQKIESQKDAEAAFIQVVSFWLVGITVLPLSLLVTRFMTWHNKKVCGYVILVLALCGAFFSLDAERVVLSFNTLVPLDTFLIKSSNIVLSLCAVYFCIFELRELAADCPVGDSLLCRCFFHLPSHVVTSIFKLVFAKTSSPYLESYWNRIQLPLFVLVLVYAVCELTSPFPEDTLVYAGIPTIFLLCLMCVQYLEAFRDVGYLLPMMRRMLTDVFRYLAFYLPIQCGYACAYYLLFKSQGENLKPYKAHFLYTGGFISSLSVIFPSANVTSEATLALLEVLKTKDKNDIFQGYETVPKSFVTTYLVTFAQINMEPFDQLASPAAYVLGYLLLVTHATIVIVMLLNVLIAMMDKTMGAHMDEAKLEACVTFAECVLRMEKTTTSTSEAYWGSLDMDMVDILYEELMHADDNEKRESGAVLDALASLGTNVDDLQKRV